MSIFNKTGTEFTHLVCVARDPATDPTYSHKFPTLVGNKVVERWSTKVRPIKSLTHALQGVRLKRYQDYMIDFNPRTQQYEYWFLDGAMATLFALVCGTMLQTVAATGNQFAIECPHCAGHFATQDIKWI